MSAVGTGHGERKGRLTCPMRRVLRGVRIASRARRPPAMRSRAAVACGLGVVGPLPWWVEAAGRGSKDDGVRGSGGGRRGGRGGGGDRDWDVGDFVGGGGEVGVEGGPGSLPLLQQAMNGHDEEGQGQTDPEASEDPGAKLDVVPGWGVGAGGAGNGEIEVVGIGGDRDRTGWLVCRSSPGGSCGGRVFQLGQLSQVDDRARRSGSRLDSCRRDGGWVSRGKRMTKEGWS